jgi:hypothetical protein
MLRIDVGPRVDNSKPLLSCLWPMNSCEYRWRLSGCRARLRTRLGTSALSQQMEQAKFAAARCEKEHAPYGSFATAPAALPQGTSAQADST